MNTIKTCKFQKLSFFMKVIVIVCYFSHVMCPGYVKESHQQNDCILRTGKAAHMSLLQAARNKLTKW